MNSLFPPAFSPEWYKFVEERIITEVVDDDRQWQKIREMVDSTTGLDPIMAIVSLGFGGVGSGSGSGSGSGIGSCGCGCGCTVTTRTLLVSGFSGVGVCNVNGSFTLTNSLGTPCTWTGGGWNARWITSVNAWVISRNESSCLFGSTYQAGGGSTTCTDTIVIAGLWSGTCCFGQSVSITISTP